ncbi:3-oxoacyl-[acyl-carrier-protein] reductase FabG [Planctomycetes bacterium MalM25]|nr:3-oxoacyl-[acyl-carrier-protein] reductase FabG [Planctomycetes bacterium MalM25]
MNAPLASRTALITGSTRGLGKAIALELARRGARVAMNYFGNQEVADAAFAELQAVGGEHCLVRGDVTDEPSVDRLLAEITERIGPVDILVLNATCEQPELPIEEYDWAFCQRMVDFFFKSPFLLTKACLPHMKSQRWGRIVHLTSEVFAEARADFCPYVAAKGAQIGLAKSSAAELAPHGVTVNCVAPGWVPVERHADATEEDRAGYLASSPIGRFGTPADIAGAVAYLASEEAAFVNGASIDVNGGRTIG